jgi:hypothetical protein
MNDPTFLLKLALFLAPGVLILLTGLWLLKRGLWPARKGTDPHCSHCGYNLTGLRAGLCPECGQPWTPEIVVTGSRQRRPGRAAIGTFLTLLAGLWVILPFADDILQFNYFRLLPTRLVLLSVNASGTGAAGKAIDVVAGRLAAGTVPADVAEQFFRRVATFGLNVKGSFIEGKWVGWGIVFSAPQVPGVTMTHGVVKTTVDGRVRHDSYTGTSSSNLTSGTHAGWLAIGSDTLPLGHHTLQADCDVRYTWSCPGGAAGKCQFVIPLQTSMEVLPAGSSELIHPSVPLERIEPKGPPASQPSSPAGAVEQPLDIP